MTHSSTNQIPTIQNQTNRRIDRTLIPGYDAFCKIVVLPTTDKRGPSYKIGTHNSQFPSWKQA